MIPFDEAAHYIDALVRERVRHAETKFLSEKIPSGQLTDWLDRGKSDDASPEEVFGYAGHDDDDVFACQRLIDACYCTGLDEVQITDPANVKLTRDELMEVSVEISWELKEPSGTQKNLIYRLEMAANRTYERREDVISGEALPHNIEALNNLVTQLVWYIEAERSAGRLQINEENLSEDARALIQTVKSYHDPFGSVAFPAKSFSRLSPPRPAP